MTGVSGWEGKVKYSNRQVEESIGTGNDVLTDFDLDYPAVTELGDVTDDATKIEVFVDGVLQTPTTDYTLDGDGGAAGVGQVSFVVAPAQDEVLTASYYGYQEIGYIQSVSFSHSNNVESIRELGNRSPVELKAGNIDISLSMTRCFIDLGLVSTVVHQINAVRGWLASDLFDIEIYPKGTTVGYPEYVVRGKFNNYGLEMPQDGVLMDTVDMVGKTVEATVAS